MLEACGIVRGLGDGPEQARVIALHPARAGEPLIERGARGAHLPAPSSAPSIAHAKALADVAGHAEAIVLPWRGMPARAQLPEDARRHRLGGRFADPMDRQHPMRAKAQIVEEA